MNEELTTKGTELEQKQKELAAVETRLATVEAETDEALRKVQTTEVQGVREEPRSPQVVESGVDNLLGRSSEQTSRERRGGTPRPGLGASGGADRRDAIQQLFDTSGAVRVRAYGALLPRYANDPTLVPEILAVARANSRDANGIYNALVVLSHTNAASLRPHRPEIIAFCQGRTAHRAARRRARPHANPPRAILVLTRPCLRPSSVLRKADHRSRSEAGPR